MSAIQAACTHYLRRCLVPDEAVVGMRLYRDVRLPDGRVLLPAGSVLDAEMLVRLKGRGVEYIHVAIPDERSPEEAQADADKACQRVDLIFRGESSQGRDSLHQIVRAFRLKEVQSCPMAE